MNNLTSDIYPFIKRESDRDKGDEKESRKTSLLKIPTMPDNNRIDSEDPDDEFLRLTAMVREVYFSHLYKSLISNYLVCCKTKDSLILENDLKKCAGLWELEAVRCSLEATLYRQAMLKMISDLKDHTSLKRVHKKLILFLNAAPSKIDVGVQTEEFLNKKEIIRTPDTTSIFVNGKYSNVQNSSVTSNYDESVSQTVILERESMKSSLDERVSLILEKGDEEKGCLIKLENNEEEKELCDIELTDENLELKNDDDDDDDDPFKSIEDFACLRTKNYRRTNDDIEEIFGVDNAVDLVAPLNDNNESQDSILQNLEDMFCESNDSSDLMALIEKHSGISKANVDLEIGKMCPESCAAPKSMVKFTPRNRENLFDSSELNKNKRKLSFSNYKKLKRHAGGENCSTKVDDEIFEEKKKKRESIWFVERIHQISKLRAKMMEISSTNYRKHGRIKAKFIQLFGDNDDEEMMPDSPICIEEHLSACKERIAPWVVKYLMPFYKKKRIIDRKLFKSVAKHVADMLIIENTFPEETDVNKYIQKYFRNKKAIKTKPDIFI